MKLYDSLNEAEKYDAGLAEGETEIYYWKDISIMGDITLLENFDELPITVKDVYNPAKYGLLGKIKETDLEKIFILLQG